jgi:hypothetical protein
MTIEEFKEELYSLAVAFDHNLKNEKVMNWFEDFQDLTRWQFHQLSETAKRELERFPPAKFFFSEVISRQWRPIKEVKRDQWIVVECPRCDGEFAVTTTQLNQAVERSMKYECVNKMHWKCPMVFDPKVILRKAPNAGDIIRKADWGIAA